MSGVGEALSRATAASTQVKMNLVGARRRLAAEEAERMQVRDYVCNMCVTYVSCVCVSLRNSLLSACWSGGLHIMWHISALICLMI